MMWFKIAWRNTVRNSRRSFLTASVVAVATMGLLCAFSYLQSTFHNVREGTIASGVGHLQIAQSGVFSEKADYPLEFGLSSDDVSRLTSIANEHSSVQLILPRLAFEGLLSNGERTVFARGQGVDILKERRLTRGQIRIVSGKDFDPLGRDATDSVIIGKGLAELLKASPGDILTLLGPTSEGGINAMDVTVLGIADSGTPARDRSYMVMPLSLTQNFLVTDKIDRLVVVVDSTTNTQTTQSDLTPLVSQFSSDIEIKDWQTLTPFYGQLVSVYKFQFIVLGAILIAVGLISALNALTMSVMERTREIGTLRAMGIKPSFIQRSFVWEGLFLGVLGALLGGACFAVLSLATAFHPILMPPPPNRNIGYPLSFAFSPPALLGLCVIFGLCGAAAARFVTSRISKMSVREALTHV